MTQHQIVQQVQFETLEAFTKGQNNYYAHFLRDNPFGESRRIKPHFLRFQEQNPEMERELTDAVTEARNKSIRKEEDLPLEQLFESYPLMSQLVYAEDPDVKEYSHPEMYLIS